MVPEIQHVFGIALCTDDFGFVLEPFKPPCHFFPIYV